MAGILITSMIFAGGRGLMKREFIMLMWGPVGGCGGWSGGTACGLAGRRRGGSRLMRSSGLLRRGRGILRALGGGATAAGALSARYGRGGGLRRGVVRK